MAEQTARKTQPTVYVILRVEDDSYRSVGTIAATSPEAALRAAGLDAPEPGHDEVYVLVPKSNWTAIRASVEQPPPKVTLTRATPKFQQLMPTDTGQAEPPHPADVIDRMEED